MCIRLECGIYDEIAVRLGQEFTRNGMYISSLMIKCSNTAAVPGFVSNTWMLRVSKNCYGNIKIAPE